MNQNNVLMILERAGSNLEINKKDNEYVLEGVFAQFGVENNNHRIYEEKEYLPHLEYLKKKITENRLLGELDHPDKFDISLSKVSHLIEDVKYDPKKRQIVGRIKLLDTPSGQIAKNLVDSGVPVSISSRAAGIVKENKKVEIKRIFTYDLVADPGFENAKLSKINESFGFSNTDENIAIYDMGNNFPLFLESSTTEEINKENTEKTMENKEFVSVEEMNKYSLVIKNEIEKINDRLTQISESASKDEKIAALEEELDNLRKYANYLAESQNKAIKYGEYLAEKLSESIAYTEHVAEKADMGIQYVEHVAEKADRGIQYSEHIAESGDKTNKYVEYMAGKLDEAILYGEYLAGKINEAVAYAEYVAEHTDNSIRYSEYLAENSASKEDFKNLTEYAEYMFESMTPKKDGKTVDQVEESTDKGIIKDAVIGKVDESVSVTERYSNLDAKIEAVLESVKKQKTDDKSYISSYPFLTFLSESKRDEFLALNETEKKRVKQALDSKPSFNEETIVKVWESALASVEVNESWLTDMPVEYLPLWENATSEMKDKIARQAKLYNLQTPYQIKNFWQTRGLGKTEDINESMNENRVIAAETIEKPTALGYGNDYIQMMKEKLGKSFSR
jgi:hypothetical protein